MTDPLEFSCPSCGSILSVPSEFAGAEGPCPVCGTIVTVPDTLGTLIDPLDDAEDHETYRTYKNHETYETTDTDEEFLGHALPSTTSAPEPDMSLAALLDPWAPPTTSAASGSPNVMAGPKSPTGKSPGLARWVALFILVGGFGVIVWLARDSFFQKSPSKPNKAQTIAPDPPATAGKHDDRAPATPPPVPAIPPADQVIAIAPVVPALPADPPPTEVPPVDVVTALPTPAPVVSNEAPPPKPALPSPAAAPVLPVPAPVLARDFKDAVDAFLGASTPEARLPLLFSSQWSPEQLAGQLVSGRLSDLPHMEYKAVVHTSNPKARIQHYHIAVKTTGPDGQSPGREILLHLTNQGEAGFRINADALAFHLENPIPGFVAKPTDDPLHAWVFIERGRFLGESDIGDRLCLNLRMSPYTPIVAQALVEADSPVLPTITPWLGWGNPPKPVFLELRHSKIGQIPILTLGNQVSINWLTPPAL